MKLALLFAIVFCVGVALARDIPQKKSAHARLVHNKHSRAHKQRHVSSKRDFNSEMKNILECVQKTVDAFTKDEDTNDLTPDEADQIFMDIVEYCETEGKNPDGDDDSTDAPTSKNPDGDDDSTDAPTTTEAEEGTTEGGQKKRQKLNQQKRHKRRSHHAKAARAHEKKQ